MRCMPEPKEPFRLTTKDGADVLPSLLPIAETLDGTLGVEILSATQEEVVAQLDVDNRHKQPFALVHGGVYACVAESAASIGGMLTAVETGGSAVGISNNTAFVRPFVGDGILRSVATRIHGGKTTQLWDVDHRDPQGRLCATSRVTIALRPAPVGPKA